MIFMHHSPTFSAALSMSGFDYTLHTHGSFRAPVFFSLRGPEGWRWGLDGKRGGFRRKLAAVVGVVVQEDGLLPFAVFGYIGWTPLHCDIPHSLYCGCCTCVWPHTALIASYGVLEAAQFNRSKFNDA